MAIVKVSLPIQEKQHHLPLCYVHRNLGAEESDVGQRGVVLHPREKVQLHEPLSRTKVLRVGLKEGNNDYQRKGEYTHLQCCLLTDLVREVPHRLLLLNVFQEKYEQVLVCSRAQEGPVEIVEAHLVVQLFHFHGCPLEDFHVRTQQLSAICLKETWALLQEDDVESFEVEEGCQAISVSIKVEEDAPQLLPQDAHREFCVDLAQVHK
mmetsp:Transcript_13468/g.31629  ORF Transcript_13468/g.31629 Transcript_13468/m.31629 type:complete len:208 (+) Transcript_13468:1674-2297(+)